MRPTAKDMKVGAWRKEKYSWHAWTLRIAGSPIIVGHASQAMSPSNQITVLARLSNISGDIYKLIPYPCNESDMYAAWEECMDELLKKLFI